MAFSDLELAKIERVVGGLCNRRNRPEMWEELRLEYRVHRHDVVVFEVRDRYGRKVGVTDEAVAKLKYVRTANEWRLYWMRADLKWHSYEPLPSSNHLIELVAEIDQDRYHCFFG